MAKCEHTFESKGKFFKRQQWILGGEVFTVFRCKECTNCKKQERQVLSKKRVTTKPDTYERQLKFSGIRPEDQIS